MRVLITGSSGALGYALLRVLCAKGFELFVTYREERSNFDNVLFPEARAFRCDLTRFDSVLDLISAIKPEMVVHLAADNDNSQDTPRGSEILRNNVTSLLNLLSALDYLSSKPKVLVTSSIELEKLTLGNDTFTPYQLSKKMVEMLTVHYASRFPTSHISVVRVPNVFGPGDINFARIVPYLAQSLVLKRQPIIKRPQARLQLIYSYSAASELLRIMTFKPFGSASIIFRLKEDKTLTVADLYDAIESVYLQSPGEEVYVPEIACELSWPRTQRDNTRKGPVDTSFDTALSATFHWYRAYLVGQDL